MGIVTQTPTDRSPDDVRPRIRIDVLALLLIVAQVAFVAWSTSTTWFKQDDYSELLLASRAGGFPGTLFQEFNGHLIPAVLALVSAVHWLFGMNWAAVVTITALMQLVASYLTWRVLRSFFGERPLALLLFVTYLTSLLAFQTVMWWCTVTIYLPLQIAFPASVLLLQRALRRRSTFDAILPAVAVLSGALFFEKALTVTPFLILLVAATKFTPSSGDTPRARLREARLPLLLVSCATITYAIVYQLVTRTSPYRPQFEAARLSNFSLEPLTRVFLPSFTGGPFPIGRVAPPLPNMYNLPGSLQIWLTSAAAIALAVWSLVTYRRVLRYWLILAGFFIVNLLMILLSGREWALNPRYYAELVFPTIFLIGFAVGAGIIDPLNRRRPRMSSADRGLRTVRLATGTIAALTMICVSTLNMNEMRKVLEPAPARPYSEQALRSSEAIGHPVTLIRQFVSGDIINGIFLKDLNYTYVVLQPMAGPWAFADASTDPYMVLEDGTVVPAGVTRDFQPITRAGACTIDLTDGDTTVLETPGDTYPWTRYGSISTSAADPVEVAIDWNGSPAEFTVPAGISTTAFILLGGGETISLTATGGNLCVTDLHIGRLERRLF